MLSEKFIYESVPHYFLEFLEKYFALEVEGAHNLPKNSRALIAPNHSGFLGFDAMLLAHELKKLTGNTPRVLTHYMWFVSKLTATAAKKVGFIEATKENGIDSLNQDKHVVLFPEGEYGNFKPSLKAYHLQEFKRGFVRLALQTHSPIIPTLVIGAEESNLTLSQLRLPKIFKNLVLPIPLNLLPLPARWKIIFLKPVSLPYQESAVHDSDLVHEICESIREEMQSVLTREVQSRKSRYHFPFIK